MGVNEEAVAANKHAFLDFLDQDVGKGVYLQAVRNMVQSKRHRLTIGMDDLACWVIRSPGEFMQSDAVTEVARNLDPKFLKEGQRVLVGFTGPVPFPQGHAKGPHFLLHQGHGLRRRHRHEM